MAWSTVRSSQYGFHHPKHILGWTRHTWNSIVHNCRTRNEATMHTKQSMQVSGVIRYVLLEGMCCFVECCRKYETNEKGSLSTDASCMNMQMRSTYQKRLLVSAVMRYSSIVLVVVMRLVSFFCELAVLNRDERERGMISHVTRRRDWNRRSALSFTIEKSLRSSLSLRCISYPFLY